MQTRTLALDRLLTLAVGLLLLAGAVAAWLWYLSLLPEPVAAQQLDAGPARRVVAAPWWPWAVGVAGVILVLAGLLRLVAHLPRRRVHLLRLRGSGDAGTLAVDADALMATAADELADVDGVTSARGRVRSDRGQLVAALVVVVDSHAALAPIVTAADHAASAVAAMVDRDDLTFGVDLRVSRRRHSLPRAQ